MAVSAMVLIGIFVGVLCYWMRNRKNKDAVTKMTDFENVKASPAMKHQKLELTEATNHSIFMNDTTTQENSSLGKVNDAPDILDFVGDMQNMQK